MELNPIIQATLIKVASDWSIATANYSKTTKGSKTGYKTLLKRNFVEAHECLEEWANKKNELKIHS
jgi:hypothetical protein